MSRTNAGRLQAPAAALNRLEQAHLRLERWRQRPVNAGGTQQLAVDLIDSRTRFAAGGAATACCSGRLPIGRNRRSSDDRAASGTRLKRRDFPTRTFICFQGAQGAVDHVDLAHPCLDPRRGASWQEQNSHRRIEHEHWREKLVNARNGGGTHAKSGEPGVSEVRFANRSLTTLPTQTGDAWVPHGPVDLSGLGQLWVTRYGGRHWRQTRI